MVINLTASYLTFGLLIHYVVSKLDNIEMSDDFKESDKPISPHLVILFWPILLISICYYFIKN